MLSVSVASSPRARLSDETKLNPRSRSLSPVVFPESYHRLEMDHRVMEKANMVTDDETIGDCAVCYDKLYSKKNNVNTTCGHLFCVTCFVSWIKKSKSQPTCPICRYPIEPNIKEFEDNRDFEEFEDFEDFEDNQEFEENTSLDPTFDYTFMNIEQDAVFNNPTTFMMTNPTCGDLLSELDEYELDQITKTRENMCFLFLKNRFEETLFSKTYWSGKLHYQHVPKSGWLNMWESLQVQGYHEWVAPHVVAAAAAACPIAAPAPSTMFEFVLRGDSYNPESNIFGYITSTTCVFNPANRTYSFAFNVKIFNQQFETTLMTIVFEKIRRIYHICSDEVNFV